jgi:hypothetical protein
MSDKKYVTYEEFGAKGDGVTDDFFAIKAAHDYANENGLAVKANDAATYYIHETRVDGEPQSAVIKTDTDWGEANFIIDDTDISLFKDASTYPLHKANIFKIVSDYPVEKIDDAETLERILADGLNRETKKIALTFDYPVMIIPYNSKHNVYRRKGYGGFNGFVMHEVIVLDKDGNIDKDTPVMFDYKNLDYIEVLRLDIKPITVEGGTFTTRASRVNNVYTNAEGNLVNQSGYILRGIGVNRSFTTVKNVKHYITGEIELNDQVDENGNIVCVGYGYHGFFAAAVANEVTFEGCVLTGRRCYHNISGGHLGTYDLTGNNVNKIIFNRCTQSNFWIKIDENNKITAANEGDEGAITSMTYRNLNGTTVKVHWGIGGTNFCKNMEYHNSTLSRFDAHNGLYNGKIINSTVNYMAITGNGDFIVENSRWFAEASGENSNSMIHLRADYGSTWEGEIKMKNVKAFVYSESQVYLYMHKYANWYYGYIANYPNISIDNVEFYDINTREPLPAGYEILISGNSIVNEPALHLPKTVNTHPVFPDIDLDGDGFVDGTKIPYDDVVSRSGILDESSYENLNPIAAPKFIKITSNEGASIPGKCVIKVYDTANYKDIPDGGFFGKTEFISDNNKYDGTDYVGEDTETFKFITIE